MICDKIDSLVKEKIKNLEILWCATLNDGTTVYSDYDRPAMKHPWERLKEHCANNDLYVCKIEVIMFGAERQVVFQDDNGLDGFFIVRGVSRELNVGTDELGPSFKQLAVGLLRDSEDIIDVRKYCWPQNEFEQFEQTRVLTEDNAKLMLFKNDSTKKSRQSVQIALNGAGV
jgi:hypothetical protein